MQFDAAPAARADSANTTSGAATNATGTAYAAIGVERFTKWRQVGACSTPAHQRHPSGNEDTAYREANFFHWRLPITQSACRSAKSRT
jgi:hypothetical protein